MEKAYIDINGNDLFFKILDNDNNIVGKGNVKYDNDVNLIDNYYFSKDYGVYKKINDENKEILFLNGNIGVVAFDIVIDSKYLSFSSYKYPLFLFENGNDFYFNFNNSEFSLDLVRFDSNYFYKCVKDGKFLFLQIDVKNELKDFINNNVNGLHSHISGFEEAIFNYLGEIENKLSVVKSIDTKIDKFDCNLDLSPILEKLDNIDNDVSKFESTNVDLSSVLNKLDDIDNDISKIENNFNILELINLPQKIEEKISVGLSLKSLNGSNGAKFKDGAKVKILNFEGVWEVLFSTTIVADENVLSVIYQVKQDDNVMFIPEVYLELA